MSKKINLTLRSNQMNTDMLTPKNETEELLIPITKNRATLIEQTQTKPQETLEFKLTKTMGSF